MWLTITIVTLLTCCTLSSHAKHIDLPYNHTTKTIILYTHSHEPVPLLISFTDPTLNLLPTLTNLSLYLDKHAKHKI